jgi:hypothetical protein
MALNGESRFCGMEWNGGNWYWPDLTEAKQKKLKTQKVIKKETKNNSVTHDFFRKGNGRKERKKEKRKLWGLP